MLNINNKPWDKLRFPDIKKHLENFDDDETFFFEYKKDDVRNESVLKEVSAFANTYGGYIFIGIKDDKTIEGCNKWTEQKIHNVIYNGISPTPIFDVKKFKSNGCTILVIKVEESPMPPYITNDGKIFERVSSGSMPVKSSDKLAQLNARHRDQLKKLENKIGINELRLHDQFPENVCAYVDLGFEIQCRDIQKVKKEFFDFDVKKISEYIRELKLDFSISNIGYSYLITLGKVAGNKNGQNVALLDAGLNNFIEIMHDGSVRCRVCLSADDEDKVNVGTIVMFRALFGNIYELLFEKVLNNNFIYARKYEKLVAVKQFVPYFTKESLGDFVETFNLFLSEHNKLYGNNLIVCGNRIPPNDFDLVDRIYFEKMGKEFKADNIVMQLFHSAYSRLGYIYQKDN